MFDFFTLFSDLLNLFILLCFDCLFSNDCDTFFPLVSSGQIFDCQCFLLPRSERFTCVSEFGVFCVSFCVFCRIWVCGKWECEIKKEHGFIFMT